MSDVDEFLAHHGIKGMRWGVRKKESSSPVAGGLDPLTTFELGALGAIVGAKVLGGLAQGGEFRVIANKGHFLLNGQKFEFKKDPTLAKPSMSSDELMNSVVKGINPKFGGIGTKMNCRRCTFAYEMRRRGYNVEATRTSTAKGASALGVLNAISPKQQNHSVSTLVLLNKLHATKDKPDSDMKQMMKGFPIGGKGKIPHGSAKSIFETLSTQPNGSRGEIGIGYKTGGGHSMAYEIVKGKPVIFDTQKSMKFSSEKELLTLPDMKFVNSAGFTRLDNVPLNKVFLQRWVKNA